MLDTIRLETEAARRTCAQPDRAKFAKTFHEHRVGREGLLLVDQAVEQLVVPGGGHVEQLFDSLFLGAAYFHHWRSKARIPRSRAVKPSSGSPAPAASIRLLASRLRPSGRPV